MTKKISSTQPCCKKTVNIQWCVSKVGRNIFLVDTESSLIDKFKSKKAASVAEALA